MPSTWNVIMFMYVLRSNHKFSRYNGWTDLVKRRLYFNNNNNNNNNTDFKCLFLGKFKDWKKVYNENELIKYM